MTFFCNILCDPTEQKKASFIKNLLTILENLLLYFGDIVVTPFLISTDDLQTSCIETDVHVLSSSAIIIIFYAGTFGIHLNAYRNDF